MISLLMNAFYVTGNGQDEIPIENNSKITCSGCGNKGHNIKKCENPKLLKSIEKYEKLIKDVLQYRFTIIDSLDFDNIVWYESLNVNIINIGLHELLMELPLKFLRKLNAKNNCSNKNKKQLIDIFIKCQIIKMFNAIEEGTFVINNADTWHTIICYKKFYCDLSDGESYYVAHNNYYKNMEFWFSNKITKIKLVCIESEDNKEENFDCSVCLDSHDFMKKSTTLDCEHVFCGDCIHNYLKKSNSKSTCPLCRNQIKKITIFNKILAEKLTEFCEECN